MLVHGIILNTRVPLYSTRNEKETPDKTDCRMSSLSPLSSSPFSYKRTMCASNIRSKNYFFFSSWKTKNPTNASCAKLCKIGDTSVAPFLRVYICHSDPKYKEPLVSILKSKQSLYMSVQSGVYVKCSFGRASVDGVWHFFAFLDGQPSRNRPHHN